MNGVQASVTLENDLFYTSYPCNRRTSHQHGYIGPLVINPALAGPDCNLPLLSCIKPGFGFGIWSGFGTKCLTQTLRCLTKRKMQGRFSGLYLLILAIPILTTVAFVSGARIYFLLHEKLLLALNEIV